MEERFAEKNLFATVGIAAEGRTCGSTAPRTQFNAFGSSPVHANASHGYAFSEGERLVLRFLDACQFCVCHSNRSYDGTLCSGFCTTCCVSTQDATDIKPCISDKCVSQ